jgi:hypothetical protein
MFNPWECPRCHTIYSPYVPQCHCKLQTTSTGTGTGNELRLRCNICNGYDGLCNGTCIDYEIFRTQSTADRG